MKAAIYCRVSTEDQEEGKMKQKSLRQLARELGVSASYLSQVKNGKRPASQKVLSKVLSNDGQIYGQYAKILSLFESGGVLELADRHDLGSCAFGRGGSTPPFPTMVVMILPQIS